MAASVGLGLRWIGLAGIATFAVMRLAVFFAPQVLFDVDPALHPEPLGGLGPAGSMVLDVLLLLAIIPPWPKLILGWQGTVWTVLLYLDFAFLAVLLGIRWRRMHGALDQIAEVNEQAAGPLESGGERSGRGQSERAGQTRASD